MPIQFWRVFILCVENIVEVGPGYENIAGSPVPRALLRLRNVESFEYFLQMQETVRDFI